MTLQKRYALALQRKGEQLVKRTFRYQVYSRAAGGYYYLGAAGALRVGHSARSSVPASTEFKDQLLDSLP